MIMSNEGTMMSPGSRLAQHRLARGWSQTSLAERCKVSRTEISAIEIGRLVPSVTVALRLALAFGESVETLFGSIADTPSPAWAWPPRWPDDRRVWRAMVHGRLLAYPVEPTAAGVIPHDGMLTAGGALEIVSPHARPDRTIVLAGCDPLVGLLVQEVAAQHGVRVLPLLRSSTVALALLRQGLVHMAGVHLTTSAGAGENDQAVRTSLGAGHTLIHQLCWDAGIALAPSRRERSTRALLRANLRWVNREEGSAARMTFDRLLGGRQRPQGYERVVHDHRAVAATVSSGWAEAGMCVGPAAAEAHLTFIALQQESYELCVSDELLDDPRIVALTTTLQSVRYRRLVSDVPGCVAERTGERRAVASGPLR
jgi:molybdate-binding protein/transcriptional regulator with XRE-family HTH domain